MRINKQTAILGASLLISGLLIACSMPILFNLGGLQQQDDATIPAKMLATKSPKIHPNSLTKYPIFGDYIIVEDTNDIPNTLLNISLVGTMLSSNPNDSSALIKVGAADEKLYFIQDKLPGGATLIRVLENAILIRRNNQIEQLSLPKDKLNTNAIEPPVHFEEQ